MSWVPEGSARPWFSARYSSSTSWPGSPAGRRPQIRRITDRVPVAMPARSIQWKAGCTPTTTMEPGGVGFSCEQKGWSIQPPARARR